MNGRALLPARPESIESVKGYLTRAFPHCRIEAFWTVDPVEYTFVAFDVRHRSVCSVILEREILEADGPETITEVLEALGLVETLRTQRKPLVRVTKDRRIATKSSVA